MYLVGEPFCRDWPSSTIDGMRIFRNYWWRAFITFILLFKNHNHYDAEAKKEIKSLGIILLTILTLSTNFSIFSLLILLGIVYGWIWGHILIYWVKGQIRLSQELVFCVSAQIILRTKMWFLLFTCFSF